MLVDFHNHIDLYTNHSTVANECASKDIYVLAVTTTPKAWEGTNRLVRDIPHIKVALGFHPQLAQSHEKDLVFFEKYLPRAKYIGEVGLDGGPEWRSTFNTQLKAFRHILSCIDKAGGRIISIHCRKSVDAVLAEIKNTACIPVLHWFSGSKDELSRAIDIGCWFSVNPQMLASKKGRESVELMPSARIITETDGPFGLYNGNKLYPWDVTYTFKFLSILWNIKIEDVESKIFENFVRLLKSSPYR